MYVKTRLLDPAEATGKWKNNAMLATSVIQPVKTEEPSLSAWVLQVSAEQNIAISQYEMSHIEESPKLKSIPGAPEWCRHVMLWKNQIIPVMDFTYIHSSLDGQESSSNMFCILRLFDNKNQTTKYGAIKILQPPVLESVTNHQAIDKIDIESGIRDISISAFKRGDESIVPIIDIQNLFNTTVEI